MDRWRDREADSLRNGVMKKGRNRETERYSDGKTE